MELGNSIDTQVVEDKIAEQKPGCCASLIYTVSILYQYSSHIYCKYNISIILSFNL